MKAARNPRKRRAPGRRKASRPAAKRRTSARRAPRRTSVRRRNPNTAMARPIRRRANPRKLKLMDAAMSVGAAAAGGLAAGGIAQLVFERALEAEVKAAGAEGRAPIFSGDDAPLLVKRPEIVPGAVGLAISAAGVMLIKGSQGQRLAIDLGAGMVAAAAARLGERLATKQTETQTQTGYDSLAAGYDQLAAGHRPVYLAPARAMGALPQSMPPYLAEQVHDTSSFAAKVPRIQHC